MAEKSSVERIPRYNLVTGEDTYSGQNAQNPITARRLLSLIPSINGELVREKGEALYLPTVLPSKVGAIFQYNFNDTNGVQQTKRFAATNQSIYMEVGGAWVIQALPNFAPIQLGGGATSQTALSDYPTFVVINNLLHVSDGVINWIYDGPGNRWIYDGFPIPKWAPVFTPAGAGTLNTTVGIYYWFTFADESTGTVHESSSSFISASTGPLTNKTVVVRPTPGTVNTTAGSPNVTGAGTNFQATLNCGINLCVTPIVVGLNLYVNGVNFGPILTVNSATSLTLLNNAPSTVVGGNICIAPARATNIHIYRSESEGSKLGKFLASLQVTDVNATYSDQSGFQNDPTTKILNIERPIRNDPPPKSKPMEVHKYRLFRRRENIPNRFNYTANEEVLSGTNGSPQESVPGTDANTLSDIINETAYPRPASAIRAFKSHQDALYIATENEIIPMWGDTIGEFSLSQVTAIDGGVISQYGMESTSHGLAILTYDRKAYLYPPVSPIWALTPQDINITDSLVEIGRPMRNKFLTILPSDMGNVRTLKYRYNSRDWWVISYQDTTNTYHTYVYDFETKGWFELQRGFVSLAIFEPSPGQKILVGGGTDGKVYVVDDLTGLTTPNPTLPTALFRTALIDFGHPEILHEPYAVEIEVTDPSLMDSTSVNFYLDPQDADSPGNPTTITMGAVKDTPTLFRGFFQPSGGGMGVTCRRLMIELNLTSDTNSGSFRGIYLESKMVPLYSKG